MGGIREQFKKKLAERLERPQVESARLSGMLDCYKIKLKNAGYRLVFQVDDNRIVVTVVAVGKWRLDMASKSAITAAAITSFHSRH